MKKLIMVAIVVATFMSLRRAGQYPCPAGTSKCRGSEGGLPG